MGRKERLAALAFALAVAASCGGGKPVTTRPTAEQDRSQKIRLAESYFQAGRSSEALDLLQEVVAEDPSNAGLHNYLGQMAFLAGRLPLAEQSIRKALELDPYLADAHNNLGAVLDRTGRKDEAEAEFRKALEDPTYRTPEKVLLNLGLLYASQGRDAEAVRELRRAVEANPKFYRGLYELASGLDRMGELDEAVRLYEAAAVEFRNDPEYHYRIGFAQFRLGDVERARMHLNRVLDLSPGSENAVKAAEILKLIR